MSRAPLLLFMLSLTFAGCSPAGLTARGSVDVVLPTTPETRTQIELPANTRLDDAEVSPEGRITGSCEFRRMPPVEGEDVFGVIVEIRRTATDNGLSTVSFMQRTDAVAADGHAELTLGTTAYSATDDCSIVIDYIDDNGAVGITADCNVESGAGDAAALNAELHFVGCEVSE